MKKKLRVKVTCSKCNKIRFVEYWPVDKKDKLGFLQSLKNNPYICSDHVDD